MADIIKGRKPIQQKVPSPQRKAQPRQTSRESRRAGSRSKPTYGERLSRHFNEKINASLISQQSRINPVASLQQSNSSFAREAQIPLLPQKSNKKIASVIEEEEMSFKTTNTKTKANDSIGSGAVP